MISLDLETYCDIDIRKVGLDAYTAHPTFEVMMMAYRIDDGPLSHWQAHLAPFPPEVRERLLAPGEMKWAYNSAFERLALARWLNLPIPVEGWRCSMALAYMRAFTGGLAAVGEQMLLPQDQQKQKTGGKLIRRFCMPQRLTTNQPHRRRNWQTDPTDWELFVDYNKTDVLAEEAVRDRLLPYPIPDDEWTFYSLDQRINDRGMPFDRVFTTNIARMSEHRREELLDQMRGLTGLPNPNSQSELLRWLKTQGYPFDDIREATIKRALALNLPPVCIKVLEYRQWAARTATKKAATALLSAGQDDRIRHMFQFAGASRTGRWAGRLVQPQNLQRTPKFLDPEKSSERLDTVTDLIRRGDYEVFPLLVEEPMAVFGGTMRGMFRAWPGHMLHICDYSSIEAVGLAWAARCERMLDVFRRGRDIYRDFGMSLYHKAYEAITSAERQICKSACLGCGYGLGPGKVLEDGSSTGLLNYAAAMGVELSPEEAMVAVRAYRDTYAEVVSFWYACGDAAQAVLEEHCAVMVGAFRFAYHKPFLTIRLPSGRLLYYYKPRMEMRQVRTGKQRWNGMKMVDEVYNRNCLTFMGRNQRTSQWERIVGRGSHLVENIIQALTRDILKIGLQRLDQAGFNIVGHAHDEIIVESRDGDNYHNWETMRDLMIQPIDWLPGFPIGAAGWSGAYYRK